MFCRILFILLLLGNLSSAQLLNSMWETPSEENVIKQYAQWQQFQKENVVPMIKIDSQQNKQLIQHVKKLKPKTEYDLYWILNYDLYATFSAMKSENVIDIGEADNLYLYYNLTFSNRLYFKEFRLNTYFFNEYGYRNYLDSISLKTEDLYYFKNTINYPIIKDHLDFNFMINIKSQFWKTYAFKEDSVGGLNTYLYSSYFSPGYILYSSGLTYSFWKGNTIELGLISGKFTKIKNQNIFNTRESSKLYGIGKGSKSEVVFGLNLQGNITPKKLTKNLYWENYTQIFAPNKQLEAIHHYTFDINNAVHYLFLKYLRVSLRTKVFYDAQIQEKPQLINQISFGFYLANIVQ